MKKREIFDRRDVPDPGRAPAADEIPIEFAGWLPIFEYSGRCGTHPQFRHIAEPPPGYRFTWSEPAAWAKWKTARPRRTRPTIAARIGRMVRPFLALFRPIPGCGIRTHMRTISALWSLFFKLRRGGARLGPSLRFLQTRHFQSQVLLANARGPVFLTSIPHTVEQNPWILEIEDPTTLFFPFIPNGATRSLNIADSPYFPIVKTLLESDQCKGIVTHMKATAEMLPTLFRSETITKKVSYTPLGIAPSKRWQRHTAHDETIHLLFTNSWSRAPLNFFMRGGLDILEAFAILRQRYPQLRLTLRTNLPELKPRYHRIIEEGWVRVIDRYLTKEEMDDLLADSHIFLLPSARVHIVSVLQAMSSGLAVVASDGWGFDEILQHERNGLVVPGRYGKASWTDREAGCLREDYKPMCRTDPVVVDGLVEAISRLVEDRMLRRRLGLTARRDVAINHSLEQWNAGLKAALDRAFPGRNSTEGTCPPLPAVLGEEKQMLV
jgi:glycosyltransferase involved in cell wall biosynthesis